LSAVNSIKEFKYRIIDDKVAILDKIHAAATIGRQDGTFAFTFIEYIEDFTEFSTNLNKQIEKVQQSSGLFMYDDKLRKDVIHYSTTPWLQFKGLTHARKFSTGESTPIIVFGKLFKDNGTFKMPVSVNAHHSLMDAMHVARYFQEFEIILNK
jgi:chloramphenicol O-acetyltransferase type A